MSFTGAPIIITHPTNELIIINASQTFPLNCVGTGGGSITYQWQFSSINVEKWISIMGSNIRTFIVRNLQQSEKYRCVASNEAGSTISNASTVILMRKFRIY